jgi:hypothetical protein
MEFDWTPDGVLRMRVDEVLHYLWDPIGVCDVPEARDEYYSYSAQAFGLLKNNASATEIAAYLRKIRVERIEVGRGSNRVSEEDIAELLVRWKELIFDPLRT